MEKILNFFNLGGNPYAVPLIMDQPNCRVVVDVKMIADISGLGRFGKYYCLS